MENQDTLCKQFQQASQKAEGKDFPGMDKVWARVEDKLDHKVLKNENKLWKKIAVAASFLLLFTLGYQAFKEEEAILIPENPVVNSEIEIPKNSEPSVEAKDNTETPSIVTSKQADKIIQDKINPQDGVAVAENAAPQTEESSVASDKVAEKDSDEKNKGYFETRKFNARSVQNNFVAEETVADSEVQTAKKQDPLFVVDGKAITKSKKESEALLRSKAAASDIESFDVLTEPLYIINGVEYSEEELFGTNPTSPYFPLNKQEIISTTVFQGESATNLYGDKGKKGVVVIVTKDGKPAKK